MLYVVVKWTKGFLPPVRNKIHQEISREMVANEIVFNLVGHLNVLEEEELHL